MRLLDLKSEAEHIKEKIIFAIRGKLNLLGNGDSWNLQVGDVCTEEPPLSFPFLNKWDLCH